MSDRTTGRSPSGNLSGYGSTFATSALCYYNTFISFLSFVWAQVMLCEGADDTPPLFLIPFLYILSRTKRLLKLSSVSVFSDTFGLVVTTLTVLYLQVLVCLYYIIGRWLCAFVTGQSFESSALFTTFKPRIYICLLLSTIGVTYFVSMTSSICKRFL